MSRRPFAAAVAVAALLFAATTGCTDRTPPVAAGQAGAVRRYTVRGEVVKLPSPGGGRTVSIRHEAIDDFVAQSGETVGMAAMVMPFDVAPSVLLDEVRVGDKVEFRLTVGWSPPVLRIDELRKLPPGTALEFRAARPPQAGSAR
jgi:Cu/Ag efflux protein CusF